VGASLAGGDIELVHLFDHVLNQAHLFHDVLWISLATVSFATGVEVNDVLGHGFSPLSVAGVIVEEVR
jgi:hypothetical protein